MDFAELLLQNFSKAKLSDTIEAREENFCIGKTFSMPLIIT